MGTTGSLESLDYAFPLIGFGFAGNYTCFKPCPPYKRLAKSRALSTEAGENEGT